MNDFIECQTHTHKTDDKIQTETKVWSSVAVTGSQPSGRERSTLTAFEDKLIVVGGVTNSGAVNDILVFETSRNGWSRFNVPNSTGPVAGHTTSLVGKLLVISGGSTSNEFHCLDLGSFFLVLNSITHTFCFCFSLFQ